MENQFTEFVVDETIYVTKLNKKFVSRKKFNGFEEGKVTAFIPGVIRDIHVKTGQSVKQGETLLILEAMKMKNCLKSTMDGKVKSILVQTGSAVSKNQLLIELER